jgi:hypothetical protein
MGVEQIVPPTNWVGFYCNIGKGLNQQKIRIYFLKYCNFDDFLTFRIGQLKCEAQPEKSADFLGRIKKNLSLVYKSITAIFIRARKFSFEFSSTNPQSVISGL